MKRLVIVLTVWLGAISVAPAQPDSACNVAIQHARTDFRLPEVARALAKKHLDIVVIGTASSALVGRLGMAITESWKER